MGNPVRLNRRFLTAVGLVLLLALLGVGAMWLRLNRSQSPAEVRERIVRETGRIRFEYTLSGGAAGVAFERKVISTESAQSEPIIGTQSILHIDPDKLGHARAILAQEGATAWITQSPPPGVSDALIIHVKMSLGEVDRSLVLYDSSFAGYHQLDQVRSVFDRLAALSPTPPKD